MLQAHVQVKIALPSKSFVANMDATGDITWKSRGSALVPLVPNNVASTGAAGSVRKESVVFSLRMLDAPVQVETPLF